MSGTENYVSDHLLIGHSSYQNDNPVWVFQGGRDEGVEAAMGFLDGQAETETKARVEVYWADPDGVVQHTHTLSNTDSA